MVRPRLVMCWPTISGYVAACCRALAERTEIDLRVIVGSADPNFDPSVFAGIPADIVPAAEMESPEAMCKRVTALRPDLVVISGWMLKGVSALPSAPELRDVIFILGMDTPRKGTMRQRAGALLYKRYFSRMSAVFVPGERAFQLARDFGFHDGQIFRGLYGVDYARLSQLHARRAARPGGWPRRWIFMGRYVEAKAIDVLVSAYQQYRDAVHDPWPLTTIGSGELKHLLANVEGLGDRGFVQPAQQPDLLVEHGAFVLSSRFDPWPLVVVESAAAGLPIVCTEACGSAVELVRPHYSGLTCASDDAGALARAMAHVHEHADLEAWGARGMALAAGYSAQVWAERWVRACQSLIAARR
jgi:glycosyltransferase involved in cell wall biosynthesis